MGVLGSGGACCAAPGYAEVRRVAGRGSGRQAICPGEFHFRAFNRPARPPTGNVYAYQGLFTRLFPGWFISRPATEPPLPFPHLPFSAKPRRPPVAETAGRQSAPGNFTSGFHIARRRVRFMPVRYRPPASSPARFAAPHLRFPNRSWGLSARRPAARGRRASRPASSL